MTAKPVGALIALLLGLTGFGAALPAAAELPAAATPVTIAATDPGARITMVVSPDELAAPAAGQDLHLTVTINNLGTLSTSAGVVEASVNRSPLTTTEALSAWLSDSDDAAGDTSDTSDTGDTGDTSDTAGSSALTPVLQVAVGPVAPGETSVVALSVPQAALAFPAEGVYALGADYSTGASELAEAHTSIVWKATATSPVRLAVVAPLIVPATTSGLLDAATLEEYTAPGGILSEQLDAMIGTPVTIGIDPRILASIRVLGTSAPTPVTEWLTRLSAATNATFPLAYADADLTLPLEAGAPGVVAPTSFDFAIDPSRFSAEATPAPTSTFPSDAPTPGTAEPPLPTSADLTAWDYTYPTLAWPTAGSVTPENQAALTAAGYSPTILSSENLSRGAAAQGVATTVGSDAVADSDATLSRLLDAAVTATTGSEWNAAMAELSSTVAVGSDAPAGTATTMLATIGRSWPTSGYRLKETLATLYSLPWATPSTLAVALEAPSSPAEIVPGDIDKTRANTVASLLAAEAADAQYANVAADPLALTAQRRVDLLATLSNSWQDDPTGWAIATTDYLARSTDIRSAVQIASSSTIQLLADRGSLPVTVSNKLNQAVTVYITVQPRTAVLRVEKAPVELVVEPQSSRKAQIPVQSLANGEVYLSVSLTDRAGNPVGGATTLELNVHAGWETAGTVALGAFVVVIFGIGIIRTIRKRRKAARLLAAMPGTAE